MPLPLYTGWTTLTEQGGWAGGVGGWSSSVEPLHIDSVRNDPSDDPVFCSSSFVCLELFQNFPVAGNGLRNRRIWK